MTNKLLLFFLLSVECLLIESNSINKCCKKGMIMDDMLECVDANDAPNEFNEDFVKQTFGSYQINYGVTPCKDHIKFAVVGNFNLAANGSLIDDENFIYPKEGFCIDTDTMNYTLAYICPCLYTKCIWKCCPMGKQINSDGRSGVTCEDIDGLDDWHYSLLSGKPKKQLDVIYNPEDSCSNNNKRFFIRGNIELLKDGSIYSDEDGYVHRNDYCGDYIKEGDKDRVLVVHGCLDEILRNSSRMFIYGLICLLGAILLIITSAVCFWFSDMSWISSRMNVCHNGSLFFAYIGLFLGQVNLSGVRNLASCAFTGYIMQFSFLAAFFWLNVMCIDMSWTFSGLRAPNGSRKDRDRKKFMWYSVYGWGGPSLLLILALVFEYASIVPEDSTFKPNVGLIKCWFRDTGALWLFFYGPMAFLLITNMVLFIYTSFRIIVLRRGDGALHQDDSQRHGGRGPSSRDRQRFALYAKLFSLMGISWLTEIISWAVGGSNYIWLFTDSINLLRAFFIFVIFCWKPRVWKSIKSRLACVRKCEQVANRLCCGKILHMDGHNEDQRNTSTTNSIPKETSTKVDGVEMAPA